jgi:peptidoglycan glycosyltransferase
MYPTLGHPPHHGERQRRLTHRGLPLAALAFVALVVGIVVGANSGESDAERTTAKFTQDWARGDYAAMYGLLTGKARQRTSLAAFERAYRMAGATATTVGLRPGKAHDAGPGARAAVVVTTRIFGTIRGRVTVPVNGTKVDWDPHLVFPGLEKGEALTRRTLAPQRAKILARGRQTLAEGPAAQRTSPIGSVASSIAGTVAPPKTQAERDATFARGFPPGTPVGQNGLERILETRVAGRPGGTLLAGGRPIARSREVASGPVRTTIDVKIQAAAVQALAGRFGGIAAIDPRTWEVRALAGVAFSAPQPPGSTFKIVTATAALGAGLVKLSTPFPVEQKAVIEGVDLENANGESCGGTFENSFAESCNSVFAPLGAKVGAKRLVETAERFGFNSAPGVAGAQPSTLPAPDQVGGPLAVGSTAIGQGRVLATPLEFAIVAGTILGVARPRRAGGRQDRHRGARQHGAAHGAGRGEHRSRRQGEGDRRLVHRLRAGEAPPARGVRDVREGGRRRRRGRAGGQGRAAGRPGRALSPKPSSRWVPPEVGGGPAGSSSDVQLDPV